MSTRSAKATPPRAPVTAAARSRKAGSGEASDKLGTVIAKQIEAEVLRGGWTVGQSLGSEQELMRRFKVSRSSLREAIRQLEIHGQVKMVRGVGGGLIVTEQPHQAAERALAIYLELLNAQVDELFEARKILEPLGARLAAERADDEELQTLRDLVNELGALPPKLEVVVPQHLAIRNLIGEIAANPALAIFVGALNRYTVEAIADEIATSFSRRSVADSNAHKRRIVDAIVAQDPSGAESAMRADLENRHAILRRHFRSRAKRELTDARSLTAYVPTKIHPKLGQIVAMTIAHEIDLRGMAPGDRLGSEPDLLVKYGVSRAVFREAIRILEVHGFVRTRRGHLGGLMVAEPNPSYTIDCAIEFLRASGMNRSHFPEIRNVIAVSAAQLAAERMNKPRRAALAVALSRHQASDAADVILTARALHALIGDLCGNRALAIFNRVVLELNSGRNAGLPDDVSLAVKANDTRVCEAIIAGDGPLARRRMSEHMTDVARWTEQGLSVFR
jgi:DNA-binding FadR family transcriptional regulator